MIILKLDKGMIEKLLKETTLKPGQSRDLSGKELTLELENKEVVIELHTKDNKKLIEIADVNGSFGMWFELKDDKLKKLDEILKGP